MITLSHGLLLGAALFSIGLYGVLSRRNAVLILMSIELMLNGVTVNLISFARFITPDTPIGQIFAIFVITVAAAEVGLVLAIVLQMFRGRGTVNLDAVDSLKG